jgi:amidohydrolase
MIKEGVFQNPKPDAVFGLHVTSGLPSGQLAYRGGPSMASSDELRIKVTGRQGHAGAPWGAIAPVTTSAQIVLGLQTIVSRRTNLMKSPAVVSLSTVNGGPRWNIVADSVDMTVTIRTYDAGVPSRHSTDRREHCGQANAKADVDIIELYDPTVNDERVTARIVPVLERAANGDAILDEPSGAAEDFSALLAEVPGSYFMLGIVPRGQDPAKAAANHSPDFFVDEAALIVGVRALSMVTANYLAAPKEN